jgi:hypothetical protein
MTVTTLILLAAEAGAQTLACRTPGPEGEPRILNVKELVASSDSGTVLLRKAVGTEGVDSAAVSVVTDETVCTAVTRAIDQAFRVAPSTEAYLVLRVGPRYVAFHPLGERQSLYFVDLNYVFKDVVP